MTINFRDLLLAAIAGAACAATLIDYSDRIVLVHGTAPGPLLVELRGKNYQLLEVTGSSQNSDPASTIPLPKPKPEPESSRQPEIPWNPNPTNLVDCRAPSRPPSTVAAN